MKNTAKILVSIGILAAFNCTAIGVSYLYKLFPSLPPINRIITYTIVIALCIIVGDKWLKGRGFKSLFKVSKKNIKYVFFGFLGGVVICIASAIFMYVSNLTVNYGTSSLSTLVLVLTMILFAPFGEELLFRGVIQTFLSPNNIDIAAKRQKLIFSFPVIFSAFLFGISHLVLLKNGNPFTSVLAVVFFSFVLGVFSGFLRKKTGEILPSFIAHASFNFIGVMSLLVSVIISALTPHPYNIDGFNYKFDLNNQTAFDSSVNVFIEKNLVYPERAKSNRIWGAVTVTFTINEDGSISDVKADTTCEQCKYLGYGCEEEAVRVIKSLPRIKPLIKNEHPQKTNCSFQIPFY